MKDVIAVIGLGRVGLPLALYFAERGFQVHGVDVAPGLIELLHQKTMPFIEEGGPLLLEKHLGTNFFPTLDIAVIAQAEAIVLTLGTPVDEHMNPILGVIDTVMRAMLPHLRRGQLIVLRSTLSPGTSEYLGRRIENATDFRIGQDLFLACCPERIAEGKAIEEIPQIPQIVGGIDEPSTTRAAALFSRINGTVLRTDARSAELAKLFTNMYRYLDFAIANEFMMIATEHDRNIHEIVDLVNVGNKRGGLKRPGFTGGPCLYKDGFFLISKNPFSDLISTGWRINESTPIYLIEQIKKVKPIEGRKVAILGLGFKRDIDDTRNSLSFKARKFLIAQGADVHLHDPLVPSENLEDALANADIVLMAMNHKFYETLSVERVRALVKPDAVICDIWDVFGTRRIVFPVAELPVTEARAIVG